MSLDLTPEQAGAILHGIDNRLQAVEGRLADLTRRVEQIEASMTGLKVTHAMLWARWDALGGDERVHERLMRGAAAPDTAALSRP